MNFFQKAKVRMAKNNIFSHFIFTPSHLRVLIDSAEANRCAFECFSQHYMIPASFSSIYRPITERYCLMDLGANRGYSMLSIVDQINSRRASFQKFKKT